MSVENAGKTWRQVQGRFPLYVVALFCSAYSCAADPPARVMQRSQPAENPTRFAAQNTMPTLHQRPEADRAAQA